MATRKTFGEAFSASFGKGGFAEGAKAKGDLKATIAKEKRDEEAKIRAEERKLEADVAGELRKSKLKESELKIKEDKDAAERLENTIFGTNTLNKYRADMVGSVPKEKQDLMSMAVDTSIDSIASGSSTLAAEINDLQGIRKGFNTSTDSLDMKILRVNDRELYDKIKADEAIEKGVGGAQLQKAKAQELLERDYLRVNATSDTSFDAVFEFNLEQLDKFNLKPGQYLGIPDKMTPKQWNRYKAAAEGAGIEASATTGRFLIPGARGVSLTHTFSKSASEIGNTVEGNAANTAFTKGNLFAGALSANIMDIGPDGKPIAMQDAALDPRTVVIDPKTGERTGTKLSQLPLNERINAINILKRDFVREVERHYITQAFIRNPELLERETAVKLTTNAPVFESSAAVKEAIENKSIMPGTLVKLKSGDLGVAR